MNPDAVWGEDDTTTTPAETGISFLQSFYHKPSRAYTGITLTSSTRSSSRDSSPAWLVSNNKQEQQISNHSDPYSINPSTTNSGSQSTGLLSDLSGSNCVVSTGSGSEAVTADDPTLVDGTTTTTIAAVSGPPKRPAPPSTVTTTSTTNTADPQSTSLPTQPPHRPPPPSSSSSIITKSAEGKQQAPPARPAAPSAASRAAAAASTAPKAEGTAGDMGYGADREQSSGEGMLSVVLTDIRYFSRKSAKISVNVVHFAWPFFCSFDVTVKICMLLFFFV